MQEKEATRTTLARGQTGPKPVTAIDWSDVRDRLENTRAAIDRIILPTLAEKQVVLRRRAKALALEPTVKARTEEHLVVVEFSLAYEQYGIESSYVREIYPLKDLTPLPCTPAFVLGVINVRGKILSVIDIKKFFDLPDKGLTDLNKVIILHTNQMEFGTLADAILGISLIPLSAIQSSLPTLTGIRAEYLRGVTKERLVILDAKALLLDKKIIVHEEVEAFHG